MGKEELSFDDLEQVAGGYYLAGKAAFSPGTAVRIKVNGQNVAEGTVGGNGLSSSVYFVVVITSILNGDKFVCNGKEYNVGSSINLRSSDLEKI